MRLVRDSDRMTAPRSAEMPVGILIRRVPGVTRWQREVWTCSGVMPGSGTAVWRMLSEMGEVAGFHAATLTMMLHRKDTDSLIQNLTSREPFVWGPCAAPAARTRCW